jgi:sugar-specific transcriptional regulator TrmB
MDYSKLEKLGLNRNEAIVYQELVRLGQATAGEIIKKTGFHRNIVYDNLEKLIDKGLVSFILEGKKKLFQVASPDMITEMIEKEQKDIDKKKKIAEEIQKEISKAYAVSSKKQEAVIFRGMKGIKVLLKDTVKEHADYFVFGAPESSLTILGSAFWKNYNAKRIKKKIVAKMVFNDDLRKWSKQIMGRMTQIKFLPKHFDSLSETIVYGNNVAIIVWTEKPVATLIRDPEAAKGYKQYFNVLWKLAKN